MESPSHRQTEHEDVLEVAVCVPGSQALEIIRSTHWENDGELFRKEEETRRIKNAQESVRKSNSNSWTHTKLFFSHCWRNEETQTRKRMLFAAMTERGNVFWADFLDLQNEGPVPWRKEIGDAIHSASKFVAMIDLQYLLSFNCLEELEYAINSSKPIVVAVLDQEAWNLLTVVSGAKDAWDMPPPPGYECLCSYEGKEFGPNKEPFSLERVSQIFSIISSINFCPCRELEYAMKGAEEVAARLCTFVEKNLDYTKEHAYLLSRAQAWMEAGKQNKHLLEGKGEVLKWNDWVMYSKKSGSFPPLSALQAEYVAQSVKKFKKRVGLLRAAAICATVLIFGLMVFAFIQLDMAQRHAEQAERNAETAERETAERRIAAALLLASESNTATSSSHVRAAVRSADLAQKINYSALVLPYLQTTLENLVNSSYWQFYVNSHSAPVTSVTYSPDGLYVASGGLDRTVRIRPVPVPEGTQVTGLPPFRRDVYLNATGTVRALEWSPNGKYLAAGLNANIDTRNTGIVVWQHNPVGECWKERFRILSPDRNNIKSADTWAMSWSSDSKFLVSGNDASQLILWRIGDAINADAEEPEWFMLKYSAFDAINRIRCLDFSSDGKNLALGGLNNTIVMFDISNIHSVVPTMLRFNNRGPEGENTEFLAPGYQPPSTRSWFAQQGDDINALQFSPDGTLLAGAGDDGNLVFYRVPSSAETGREFKVHSSGINGTELEVASTIPGNKRILGVAWSAKGDAISTASGEGRVRIFRRLEGTSDAQGEKFEKVADLNSNDPFTVATPKTTHVQLVTAGEESNSLRSFQPAVPLGEKGPEWFNLDCRNPIREAFNEEKFEIRGFDVSNDGRRIVASSFRGHVCVWERNGSSWDVVAVPDFSQHPQYQGRVKRQAVRRVKFSDSGNRFAAGDDGGGMYAWKRTPSGWELIGNGFFNGNRSNDNVRVISWSSDERWISGGYDVLDGVWNVDSGDSEVVEFEGSGRIRSAAWRQGADDDGCYVLATGEVLNILRIRRLCPATDLNGKTNLAIVDVFNHTSDRRQSEDILSLAWSNTRHDGRYLLASGGNGGSLVIHSLENGKITDFLDLSGHVHAVRAIAWAPNGYQLASTGPAGDDVYVWDLREDQSGENRGYTSWLMRRHCQYLIWVDQTDPQRLACGRRQGKGLQQIGEYSYAVMFSILDFDYQLSILRELQYGNITNVDLVLLGLHNLNGTVLDKALFGEPPEDKEGSCEAK